MIASRPGPRVAALAGALAVGVLLGVTELAAALLPGTRSLVVSVGDVVIDNVPHRLERATISALGTYDKPFLLVNIVVVSMLIGGILGRLSVRSLWIGVAGIGAMAAVAVATTFADPQSGGAGPVVAGAVAAVAGAATLVALLRTAPVERSAPPAAPEPIGGGMADRRRFLGAAAVAVLAASAAGLGGRLLAGREKIEAIRRTIRIPAPVRRAPRAPAGASLEIPGISPLYVPNDQFYRIDTLLITPQIDPANWSLTVKGLVERPFELTYEELLELPQVEADVTLVCVSNEVGSGLAGNARWQGVPLAALLERAGLRRGATQVLGRSVDGFTAGFPTELALDGRNALVAVAMNGEPLPASHGFPARLIIPGLYGYVSATKWLTEIELNRFDEVDGYWIPRGWSKRGPIKTQSRIDVASEQVIAGVAWAPTRGIERVELRIDGGDWRDATLAEAIGPDSWRQWFLAWEPAKGRHTVSVRATDGTGETQTAEEQGVAPDGATGHHTITVEI